jgi:hypothetical protein
MSALTIGLWLCSVSAAFVIGVLFGHHMAGLTPEQEDER